MVTMWGIHNNRPEINPVADRAVRIGWDEVGDLAEIGASRDAFKAALAARMPELGEAATPAGAGTLYRFVHVMADGDIVVCPNRSTKTLDIGRVGGPYEFHPESHAHRHWRPVTWLRTGVPRTELSEAALNELGSATTLFTIKTAEDEIAHLLASPQPSAEVSYAWADFYPRLADVFLTYQHDRGALLAKMWDVAAASGRPQLFKYLQSDHHSDGTSGPIRDVDPFTVLGTFNRGIRHEARAVIARTFGEEFGLEPPYPDTFPGVPVVNNLNSWFISWENERGPHDVDSLWELCRAAVAYATEATEETREQLVASFDACATGGTRKLTMGIYWIRPHAFAAYDSTSVTFLEKQFPEVASGLFLYSHIDGEQFLSNTERLAAWLADPQTPYNTFPELSRAAWDDLIAGGHELPAGSPAGEAIPLPPDDAPQLPGDTYYIESIRDDGCFIPTVELDLMLERLRSRKNIVLQGPPGTGKTWLARRLGWALSGEHRSSRVQVVQFHPSLTYEDFVRGWRPGTAGLELADGPFLDMCNQAEADPDNPYVLVIEEVNRGNPAQVLGELLTLIEADKRSPDHAIRLAYPRDKAERFSVPPNLHLIGTMNVADRSLAIVDMALRRRFAFIELKPAFGEAWALYLSDLGYDAELLETLGNRVNSLNDTITKDSALGRQYCVGHSYFTPVVRLEQTELDTAGWWRRVVETDVRPLLEEYWFDRPEVAEVECRKLVGD
ncbi:AAA family ATPase [Kribbella sp. NPDC003505]|uniref:AAA family ATPase n=1 Tax=Kribbella sp. NPDC003505 TaxID=3154448 RepID=UPI0033BF4C03